MRRRPDHDPIGPERVLDRRALPEELGIRDDIERDGARLIALDHLANELTRADGDRRLVDDDRVALQRFPDAAGHRFDGREIRAAVVTRWRAHGDEDDDGAADRRGEIGAEREPPVADVASDHLLQPGLVDGHPPGLELGDLVGEVVDADDFVSEIREDGAGHQADVPSAHDADVHGAGASYQRRFFWPEPAGRRVLSQFH